MQQVILHKKIGEHDKVSHFFRDFDCHNKAATAIYFHERKVRQEILTLDQVWDVTPFGIQRAPNRMIDQLSEMTSSQELSTKRSQAPREVITLDDEPDPIKRESPAAYQALEFRAERREEAIPMPVQVRAPSPVMTTMPMPMPLPQQMAIPTAMPVSTTTSIPTLMPAMARETLREVFRGDVMMELQPLLDRLKSENWNGVIQRDIMQNAMLLSWLEQARDDVGVFQWTERYVEPVPSTWANPDSAHNVFHDLDAMITGIPQLAIRAPLQAKMNMLRGIFDQQEKTHKDEMLFRVDSLQMDIAKIHDQMAESKQAEGQIAKESAVTRDDAAETDETFAVHIVERGDDTDEDLEERKKKKRKGEKEPEAEEKGKKKVEKNGGKGKKNGKKEMTMERKIKNREKRKKRSRQEMMEED
ncbi:hypothetical protein TrVFT333_007137 [Trichoderma virens FT-333]|nr:hypothetical protein TrVFT333_007137 [Trichoderma virens FT-333]